MVMATYGGENNCYRYTLERRIGGANGRCVFVMLNPSTADAERDDPTIRRCIGFAQRWGMSSLHVVNLFALRSTDPRALYAHPDPVGPDNDDAIRRAVATSSMLVCAWGTRGEHLDRARQVFRLVAAAQPYALDLTKHGHPKHPLYVRADITPLPIQVTK